MEAIIYYKTFETKEIEHTFEIADLENVFLKSKYNFCNSATYPHFAQFRRQNEIVTIYIENYDEIVAKIKYQSGFNANKLAIEKFFNDHKGAVTVITSEEFFKYYNKLLRI